MRSSSAVRRMPSRAVRPAPPGIRGIRVTAHCQGTANTGTQTVHVGVVAPTVRGGRGASGEGPERAIRSLQFLRGADSVAREGLVVRADICVGRVGITLGDVIEE